jgi:microcystin-dependent protein
MAEPFLSEIRMMSFVFPPKGWALSDGQLLPINQNQALFSLLGTTYGGDGRVNFGLPDLRARVPFHVGNGHSLGERGGSPAVTLTISQIPTHTHLVNASTTQADQSTGNVPTTSSELAKSVGSNFYASAANFVAMDPRAVSTVGGSQAHTNMSPFLVISFCIALQGIFPSQT